MTLEEAMAISEHRLPGEPPEADWRASRPAPEPKRKARGLDTAQRPEIDLAYVIRGAILAERAQMVEIIGESIGEYGNQLLDEIETTIAATASELREEFSRQIDQLRAELSETANESAANVALIHSQGEKLKAQLEEVIAKRTRTKAAKPLLQLPAPNGNGDGHSPQ
jgi:hypothetical protein